MGRDDNPFLAYAKEVRPPGSVYEPWEKPPRRRKRRTPVPGGLLYPPDAAARLGVTEEKLLGFVSDGELRYIDLAAKGSKRPRYSFSDADLEEFIESRKRRGTPQCQFSKPRSQRRTSGTNSKSTVVGFMALRDAQIAKKPKK